ncbi:MAG: carbohydrate kinase [Prevotella sp.]|nr:carbohydrate kinase [Prevotella sp.]
MKQKYLVGLDVGSSSVKASLVNIETGACAASAFYPKTEAPILSVRTGWAEQEPQMWWDNMKLALRQVMDEAHATGDEISAIGISYQMHGLVCVDKNLEVLRPAIIWCDSRAVPYGERAFRELGADQCLSHLLNSPGNFTAAKLAWVKENEPDIYNRIYKIMLPGDYIAMRLSGEVNTTASGLSEGMLWDFQENRPARFLMDYYGFSESLLPEVVPTFSIQSEVSQSAAAELGLRQGTPISYRAGDQPNNALSLNVFNPGEIASTAGTSGVVYGVLGNVNYDPKSRVNTFAHVNHLYNGQSSMVNGQSQTRLGVLLCINGTGILNAWIRRNVAPEGISYADMNVMMEQVPIGSEGVSVIPFGNGAERVLENRETGCSVHGINFNKHSKAHLMRAAQEGIVFSFCYGMEVMRDMGMDIRKIHAGRANMFLSPIFRDTLASVSGATIELYETDGSVGAAKGAGMGCGIYRNNNEAFATLKKLAVIEPDVAQHAAYAEAYARWRERLQAVDR